MLGNLLLLAGILVGLFTGWLDLPLMNGAAHVVSELFLRLLKLISLPIIFLAITSTITGMKSFQEMRKLGRKVLTYTLSTTIIAATIGLGLFLILNPAHGVQAVVDGALPAVSKEGSYLSFVLNIVPSNFFQAFIDNNVIGIVFIGLVLSIATLVLPEEQKMTLHNLFKALFSALLKVTSFVIKLMPIAIWAFMTLLMRELQQNFSQFQNIFIYLLCVVSANLIQGIVVLPIILKLKGYSPWKCFRQMLPALSVAFFAKSSNAALPITMRSIEKSVGVSKKVSSFSLPLCSVVNMNGCAAFILISTLFVSQIHGMVFGPLDYVMWIFIATLAAVGNAGVPMGCFFLTSAFLVGMNVPLYTMGLILPFYTIIDMIETALNVWSDATVTMAIDKDLKEVVTEEEEEAA